MIPSTLTISQPWAVPLGRQSPLPPKTPEVNLVIVALTGPARSGKSTVCEILRDHYDFEVIGFADPLKEMALAIDPIVQVWPWGDSSTLSDIVREYGWEEAKDEFPEVRRFLQRLGTDGVRETLGQDAWVAAWEARAWDVPNAAVPDCRFHNEAECVRAMGDGFVWRIIRPGYEAKGGHISEVEQAGIKADLTIINDGDLDQLMADVAEAMERSV